MDEDDDDTDYQVAGAVTEEIRVKREIDFLEAIYTKIPTKGDGDADILQWWRLHEYELPLLAALVRRLYCGCATSVTSERIFSLAGHIVSKKRNSLKPEMVNMLTCLAFNVNSSS